METRMSRYSQYDLVTPGTQAHAKTTAALQKQLADANAQIAKLSADNKSLQAQRDQALGGLNAIRNESVRTQQTQAAAKGKLAEKVGSPGLAKFTASIKLPSTN